MKNIGFLFFVTGIVAVVIGMAWGIQMAASDDHLLSPAHAHLNLLGWVTMGLYGVYYAITPQAAEGRLAKIHYAVAVLSLVTIVPGIVMAIRETGEALAISGAMLALASMILFLVVVWQHGLGRAP